LSHELNTIKIEITGAERLHLALVIAIPDVLTGLHDLLNSWATRHSMAMSQTTSICVEWGLGTWDSIHSSLVPRPPRPAFVACSMKSGGRPGRTYHVMHAALTSRTVTSHDWSSSNRTHRTNWAERTN